MKKIYQSISAFVAKAIDEGLVAAMDNYYLRNRLLALLKMNNFEEVDFIADRSLLDYMDDFSSYAMDVELIGNRMHEREEFQAAVMDLITPVPSQVNQNFWRLYARDGQSATDYFYQLSQSNDYIRTRNIVKNQHFYADSEYGPLEITINLSKPEKDPQKISHAREVVASTYPACALCLENEGYQGHINHAARQQHRIIRFDLNGEQYGLQYSPYVYYNEHCIFLNEVHQPMTIDRRCLENLLEIVNIFPHYFAGSNADLPIVGGSILAHDHYQGGNYTFPMEKAKAYQEVELSQFPDLQVELLYWPLSVIRLRGESRNVLSDAATYILDQWIAYSDSSLDIISHTGKERHNTVTPIARFRAGQFELDIVLRNNRQTAAHPDGIFHPHAEHQHIKKENIGLIEVMGLAILPARLVEELDLVKKYLLDEIELNDVDELHRSWAEELKASWLEGHSKIDEFIQQAVGDRFRKILENAGVFKLNKEGKAGMMRFIDGLNKGVS